MNSPATPLHCVSPDQGLVSPASAASAPPLHCVSLDQGVVSPASAASAPPQDGSLADVLRTPTGQGTDTTNCPSPPGRRGRNGSRRRVSF